MEMEWIKEKPPLEKEKSNKEISKQIDQNAKATTNLLEKVRKYGANIFEAFLLESHQTFMLDDDRQDSNTSRA